MDNRIITQSAPLTRRTTLDGRILNSLDRARNLHHYARLVSPGHWLVYSASNDGTAYDVCLTASGLRCNCKSGQWGKPCKHAARVGMRLNREGNGNAY